MRAAIASWLLMVFILGVTPKILLHDMVADHQDSPVQSNFSNNDQVSADGYTCTWDNQVVESPFVINYIPFDFSTEKIINTPPFFYTKKFRSIHFSLSGLRGPPYHYAV